MFPLCASSCLKIYRTAADLTVAAAGIYRTAAALATGIKIIKIIKRIFCK